MADTSGLPFPNNQKEKEAAKPLTALCGLSHSCFFRQSLSPLGAPSCLSSQAAGSKKL